MKKPKARRIKAKRLYNDFSRRYYVDDNYNVLHKTPKEIKKAGDVIIAGPFSRSSDILFWRLLDTAQKHLNAMCEVEEERIQRLKDESEEN